MKRKNLQFKKGFTLLELLIVIAIIGLLASVVIVQFPEAQKRARIAQAQGFADTLRGSLQMDMVANWAFDETSGTVAKDSWFDQNDGTLFGDPQWVEGLVNNAIEFDGNGDQVNFGSPASFNVTGAVTVEFWAYPINYALRRQNPICKAYGGEFCMTMEQNSSIHLYFGTAGGNGSPYTYSTWPVGTLENNEWIHLVWTKNPATNSVVAYKNGKVVQSTTCGVYCNTTASGLNLYAGTGYAGSYVGLLDEVHIYSAALPTVVIQQHYAQGLSTHQNFAKK